MAGPDGGLSEDVVAAVRLLGDVEGVAVALGGGADSAVLAGALVEVYGPETVTGVFVDHGLEGSARLREAVCGLGDQLGIEIQVVSGVVDGGSNLEARARAIRYRAFDALNDCDVVCTGHSLDDQAETILMRLASGSGSLGLGGIPRDRGRIRRPLLAFRRSRLRTEAESAGLVFTDDVANNDPRHLRNRVRSDVVPAIESVFGPSATTGLARSAALARSDDAVLDALAGRIPVAVRQGAASIPTSCLVTAAPAVASRACLGALLAVGIDRPTARDVQSVMECATTGSTRPLTGDLHVVSEGPMVRIGAMRPPRDPIVTEVGGSFEWEGVTYRVVRVPEPPLHLRGGRFTVLGDVADSVFEVRALEPGDRIDVGIGHSPVSEVLRAHGVPASLRPVSLVITVDGKIAAVAGVRVAAWAQPERGAPAIVIERKVVT